MSKSAVRMLLKMPSLSPATSATFLVSAPAGKEGLALPRQFQKTSAGVCLRPARFAMLSKISGFRKSNPTFPSASSSQNAWLNCSRVAVLAVR